MRGFSAAYQWACLLKAFAKHLEYEPRVKVFPPRVDTNSDFFEVKFNYVNVKH